MKTENPPGGTKKNERRWAGWWETIGQQLEACAAPVQLHQRSGWWRHSPRV